MFNKLNKEQEELLREGKVNVHGMKLKSLFISDEENKKTLIGRIYGYCRIKGEEKSNKEYNIFIIKKSLLQPYIFYKVEDNDLLNKGIFILYGDVIVTYWNWIEDKKSFFIIKNDYALIDKNIVDKNDKDKIGVDTIKKIAPMIHNAIQVNSFHIIRIREQKLIKPPEAINRMP
jgi:hypothetical protein